MTDSLATVACYLVVERLSILMSMTPCIGLLDIGSTTDAAGVEVGFVLISASNSRFSRSACCCTIKVGANCSMVLVGVLEG